MDLIIEWVPCGETQSWIGLDWGRNTGVLVTRLDTRKLRVLLERNAAKGDVLSYKANGIPDRRGVKLGGLEGLGGLPRGWI